MFEPQQLFLVILATLLLNITPGQDTVHIIGRTLTERKAAGTITVLGMVLLGYIYAADRSRTLFTSKRSLKNLNRYSGGLMIGTGSFILTRP